MTEPTDDTTETAPTLAAPTLAAPADSPGPKPKADGGDGKTPRTPLSLGGLLGLAPKAEDRIGEVIDGRYELQSVLGRGGMGVVYKGTQLNVGRAVAIKLVRPQLGVSEEIQRRTLERFDREMATTAQLEHPNVVRLYDVGATEDGQVYMAMEMLEGTTLQQLIGNDAPLPVARAVHIALQLASALQAAHERGIVHRDLKPANTMIHDAPGHSDVVTVLDFGLAYLTADGQEKLTQDGMMLGTPGYAAPEQIRAGEVDERADIYALGAILYEMLTGGPPFQAATALELLHQHSHAAVQRPSERVALPRALDGLVMAMLNKDPDVRPASAVAVSQALSDALHEAQQVRAPEPQVTHRAGQGSPAGSGGTGIGARVLALVVVAVAAAAALWSLWPSDTSLPTPSPRTVDKPQPEPAEGPLTLEPVDLNPGTEANREAAEAALLQELGHAPADVPASATSQAVKVISHRILPTPGPPGRWTCETVVTAPEGTPLKLVFVGPSSESAKAFKVGTQARHEERHHAGIPKAQTSAYRCELRGSEDPTAVDKEPSEVVLSARPLQPR